MKEIFYLHPFYFKPDPKVLQKAGLDKKTKFVILRFVAWNANHDIGHRGFSDQEKIHIVNKLKKHARVLISSESPLPESLRKYEIRLEFNELHHLMYHASLFFGESATMCAESAVLGVHGIYIHSIDRGYLRELRDRYGISFVYTNPETMLEQGLKKAVELLETNGLQKTGRKKGRQIVDEKTDMNAWMFDCLKKTVKKNAEK